MLRAQAGSIRSDTVSVPADALNECLYMCKHADKTNRKPQVLHALYALHSRACAAAS